MRKLSMFNTVSVDGFFTDAHGDMRWAQAGGDDAEWREFAAGNAGGGGALMLGRVTYDMMAGFWPTPAAAMQDATVVARMNEGPKFVVSRSLENPAWNNTSVLSGDLATAVRELKATDGPDIVILGSGSIVSQLTEANLIDAYQFVVTPLLLGTGRPLFETVTTRPTLTLVSSRAFKNGKTVLGYERAASSGHERATA